MEEWNTAASATASEMFASVRKLSKEMEKHPNKIIMTHRSRDLIKSKLEQDPPPQGVTKAFMSLTGIPVETLATVKECLDRMLNPDPGERLHLFLGEDVPSDCITHEFFRRQVEPFETLMHTPTAASFFNGW